MKHRIRKVLNFFAFNLLFFALYLNFIHKDQSVIEAQPQMQTNANVINGTVLVQNPEKYLQQKTSMPPVQPGSNKVETVEALKRSIN